MDVLEDLRTLRFITLAGKCACAYKSWLELTRPQRCCVQVLFFQPQSSSFVAARGSVSGANMPQATPRNFLSEEAVKCRELLHGLQVQLQTTSCSIPTVGDLQQTNVLWSVAELVGTKAKLNACKDRMDNMDAG